MSLLIEILIISLKFIKIRWNYCKTIILLESIHSDTLYIDLVDGNFIWRSSILDSKKVFLLSLSTKRIISSTPFPDHTSFSSFSMSFSFFFFFLKRINTEEQIVHFSFKRNWKLLRYNLMHLKLNLNYIWIRSTSDDISYFFK